MFLVHGLVVSTWVSRIPAVQARLGLNNGVLGVTLLGTACGSVLAIPLCGWLVTRFGSRAVTSWSTLGFCCALIPISLASNAPELAAALFLFGAMGGTMDVAMNVQGVEVEKALGKPTMSRFQCWVWRKPPNQRRRWRRKASVLAGASVRATARPTTRTRQSCPVSAAWR